MKTPLGLDVVIEKIMAYVTEYHFFHTSGWEIDLCHVNMGVPILKRHCSHLKRDGFMGWR